MHNPDLEQNPADDFQHLYLLHRGRVRDYVRRRAPSSDVDDIVSEVFLTAWRRVDDLPSAGPELTSGWLLRTAHNLMLNADRSARRRARLLTRIRARIDRPEVSAEPARQRSGRPDLEDERIAAAFAALSPGDQTILLLVAWDDCTTSEVASFLRCSPGAAKTRLSRAKARFRQLVTKELRD